MKKLITVIAALMLIVYALPLVTVGFDDMFPGRGADDIYEPGGAVEVDGAPSDTTAAGTGETTGSEEPDLMTYDEKTTITVSISGVATTLNIHDYLVGVVAAEMPANFPEEALKAQALAARTYTLYKVKLYEDGMDIPEEHNGAQLCDDSGHCKAYCDVEARSEELWGNNRDMYLGKITSAVEATDGLVAVYDGQPIAAVFHAASSEYTEAAVDVWGSSIPYLKSVESPGGEQSSKYNSAVTVTQSDFKALVLESYPAANFPSDPLHWFKNSNRSQAGGVIDVEVGGVRVAGTFIRKIAGLNSTNFRVKIDGENLIFTTTGYGHGVGMSQYGAKALADQGMTYDEIIKHYFTGVELLLKS